MRLQVPSIRPAPAFWGILAVLQLLPAVSLPLALLLALSILVAGLLPLAFTVVAGILVGSIPAALHAGLGSPAGSHTLTLLAITALLIVALRVLSPLEVALATVFGRRVDRQLQERVMTAVGRPVGIGHLEDAQVLDLIRSAQGVGREGYHPGDSVAALAGLLPSWFQAVGSAVILAAYRPWLGFAWLLMWPVILYYLQREYIRVGEAASGETASTRRADYFRDLALTAGASKEVRVWGLTPWLVSRFERSWRQAMLPIWRARKPGRAVLWLTTGTVAAMSFATFWLLAWNGVHGVIGLGALAVYLRAAGDTASFRAFDDQNMVLAYAAVSVPNLLMLEKRLNAMVAETGEALAPRSPQRAIRFEGLTFRYPGQAASTLERLDLSIPAGQSLAVVGANGAGKTTLVKLLCRLYEPTEGRIEVDGVDLARIDPEDWRRHVAAIFQDFIHYQLSVRDNVALGAPHLPLSGAEGGDELLRRAASRAGALGLIESLPQGWETILSRQYAGGVDLSGGQWQRIALTRALYAVEAGARVLILDEPTANLDVRAEAELYDRFLELTAGLTTIVISHRFSTVRRADRIVVLEGGCIVEHGTHEELLADGAIYARMFRLQAERFAEPAEVSE